MGTRPAAVLLREKQQGVPDLAVVAEKILTVEPFWELKQL
jgi:hypothetical protein